MSAGESRDEKLPPVVLERKKRLAMAIATSGLLTVDIIEAFIAGVSALDPSVRIRVSFEYPRTMSNAPKTAKAARDETASNRRAIGGAGAPVKAKRIVRCGLCGNTGHNAQTCPTPRRTVPR